MGLTFRHDFYDFPTHVMIGENGKKIGYNTLYTSTKFYVRNAFVQTMHSYIKSTLPMLSKNEQCFTNCETKLIVKVPINYGSVRLIQNKLTGDHSISWKPVKSDYEPNWDIWNLGAVWLKALDDVATQHNFFKDDNVGIIKGQSIVFQQIDRFEERQLIYLIKQL